MDWYDQLKCYLKGVLIGALAVILVIGFLYYRTIHNGYLELKKEQSQMALTIKTLKFQEVETLYKAIREYRADLEALYKIPIYDIKNPKTGE